MDHPTPCFAPSVRVMSTGAVWVGPGPLAGRLGHSQVVAEEKLFFLGGLLQSLRCHHFRLCGVLVTCRLSGQQPAGLRDPGPPSLRPATQNLSRGSSAKDGNPEGEGREG